MTYDYEKDADQEPYAATSEQDVESPEVAPQHSDPGAEYGAGDDDELAALASGGVFVVGPNPDTDNAAEVAELQRRINEPNKD